MSTLQRFYCSRKENSILYSGLHLRSFWCWASDPVCLFSYSTLKDKLERELKCRASVSLPPFSTPSPPPYPGMYTVHLSEIGPPPPPRKPVFVPILRPRSKTHAPSRYRPAPDCCLELKVRSVFCFHFRWKLFFFNCVPLVYKFYTPKCYISADLIIVSMEC